jgi:hypothetical protein
MTEESNPLRCFGRLEKVFPIGEDGFRTSPPECMRCPMATACLQAAMRGVEGLAFQEERVDRAYKSGLIGTLERWSKKKLIRRRIEEEQKKATPIRPNDGR